MLYLNFLYILFYFLLLRSSLADCMMILGGYGVCVGRGGGVGERLGQRNGMAGLQTCICMCARARVCVCDECARVCGCGRGGAIE